MSNPMNFHGVECPECGFRTHKAEFEDTVRYRCMTQSCHKGWFEQG